MTQTSDAILTLLPSRLKAARQAQGLSLDAVAKLSGVSRSMVSQIERGESSPTIATLWNLTSALQVDFAGLLEGAHLPAIEILRAEDVPTIKSSDAGCSIRILSRPEDAGQNEVYDMLFEDGGALKSSPHASGTSEQLTVIEGALTITSGDSSSRIEAGDTARYAADVDHVIHADEPSRAFLIVRRS